MPGENILFSNNWTNRSIEKYFFHKEKRRAFALPFSERLYENKDQGSPASLFIHLLNIIHFQENRMTVCERYVPTVHPIRRFPYYIKSAHDYLMSRRPFHSEEGRKFNMKEEK